MTPPQRSWKLNYDWRRNGKREEGETVGLTANWSFHDYDSLAISITPDRSMSASMQEVTPPHPED